jgi:hypothetical protein
MDDPTDSKPEDWDESAPELIPDPEAVKPDDWLDDEPFYIADPDAVKPEDWTEADGDWEAPQICTFDLTIKIKSNQKKITLVFRESSLYRARMW